MTNEEILAKDFQIFTFKALMNTNALLCTILENQSIIMDKLNIQTSSSEINELFRKYNHKFESYVAQNYPDFKDFNPPIKD